MATREDTQNMKAPEFAKKILHAGLSDAGRRFFPERTSDRYKAAADLFVQWLAPPRDEAAIASPRSTPWRRRQLGR